MNKLLIPFSGIRNPWLRENLSVLPLLVFIAFIYVSIRAGIASINQYVTIDMIRLYIYFSFVIFIVPLCVINALYITRKWILKSRDLSFRNSMFIFFAFCFGIIAGGLVMQIIHELVIDVDPYGGKISTFQAQAINFEIAFIVGLPLLMVYLRKELSEQRLRQHEIKLIRLEQLKFQAELDALQAKINPHFLYNSLNSILSLIHQDPDKAELMIVGLSRFFRYSINSQDAYYASVADELEIVETYLEIEKIRFGKRLLINYRVDEEAMYCEIPRFLLQPLVENAIKHGISKLVETGIIHIGIVKRGNDLEITVEDNGPGFPEDFISGYGLKNIYEKLDLLMKDNYEINLMNGDIKAVQISSNNLSKKWVLPSELSLSKTRNLPETV